MGGVRLLLGRRVNVNRLLLLMVACVAVSYVRVQQYAVNSHLVDTKVPASGRRLSQRAADEPVDAVVLAEAPVHGYVRKAGMTALANWHPSFATLRKTQLKAWLDKKGSLLTGASPSGLNLMGQKPPYLMHFHDGRGCNIYYNEKYKIIYLRSQKVASTTTMTFFGECGAGAEKTPPQPDPPTCLTRLELEDALQLQLMWKNYFVFGWSRNPWARAVSSYQYLLHAVKDEPQCDVVDWDSFCQDPMVFGDLCRAHPECCPHFNHIFMYFHVNDQTTCLLTDSGEWAADFVGRSEHFDEDFPLIVEEINRRLAPGVTPLSVDGMPASQNTNEVGCSDEYHPRKPREARPAVATLEPAHTAVERPAAEQQPAQTAVAVEEPAATAQAAAGAAIQQLGAVAEQPAAAAGAAATAQPANVAVTAAAEKPAAAAGAAEQPSNAAVTEQPAAAAVAAVQPANAAVAAALEQPATAAAAAVAAATEQPAAAVAVAAATEQPATAATKQPDAAVQQQQGKAQAGTAQGAEQPGQQAQGPGRRLLYGKLPGFLFAGENYCDKRKFYTGRHAACFQQIARFYGGDIQRLGFNQLLHWDEAHPEQEEAAEQR